MPEICTEEKTYIKQNCAPSWTYLREYSLYLILRDFLGEFRDKNTIQTLQISKY